MSKRQRDAIYQYDEKDPEYYPEEKETEDSDEEQQRKRRRIKKQQQRAKQRATPAGKKNRERQDRIKAGLAGISAVINGEKDKAEHDFRAKLLGFRTLRLQGQLLVVGQEAEDALANPLSTIDIAGTLRKLLQSQPALAFNPAPSPPASPAPAPAAPVPPLAAE